MVTLPKRHHLRINLTGEDGDDERNEEAYAELVQFLDDKSLSLIIREPADKGRIGVNICRHYAGKGKLSYLVQPINFSQKGH